jgi:tetratricopeptide (TPR) repeat protein
MKRMYAIPLLVGAGFLVGLGSVDMVLAQGQPGSPARQAALLAAQRYQAQHSAYPNQNRPTPRPSVPSFSRPQQNQQYQELQQLQARLQAQQRAMGERPNMFGEAGLANRSFARPITPQPVHPSSNTGGGQVATRPTTRFDNLIGALRPAQTPSQPISLPGNSNNRPSTLPSKPDEPFTRPGIIFPNRPGTNPSRPPIGERPELPNRPDRPNISWPNKPDNMLPPEPKRPIDPKFPIGPKLPGGGGNRPPITWPNRPNRPDGPGNDRPLISNRTGINIDGSRNTIVNRTTNNVTVNNINQRNNYYSNRTNIHNVTSVRSGTVNTVNGWNSSWNSNYNNWCQSYHPWYNGCWSGNIYSNWGVGPVAWGLSTWGLNSLQYGFGYSMYQNPFFQAPPADTPLPPADNYAQPIINVTQAFPESGQQPPPLPETASQLFDAARAAFKQVDYKTALTKTELALKDFPNDPVLHEFRALVLFAEGQYRQAAAVIHSVLASGPGWDWTTMSSLYADTDTYNNQLAGLEKAAADKPDDAALQFLLAYQYTTLGDASAAKDALTKANKLLPNDQIVTQLAQAAGVEGSRVEQKDPPQAAPADVYLDITGNWTATRADGGKIAMSIVKEGTFTWAFTDKSGKKESFDGTFTLEDDQLTLERKTGGALMGRITVLADNKFIFKVLGATANDPGLTFTK